MCKRCSSTAVKASAYLRSFYQQGLSPLRRRDSWRDFCHERTAELYSPESESLLRLPEGATATIHYTVNLSLTFIAFLSFIYFLCSIQTTTKTILYVRNRSCLRRRTYSLRLFYVIRWLAFFGLLISLLCLGTSWLGYELNRYDLVMGMS